MIFLKRIYFVLLKYVKNCYWILRFYPNFSLFFFKKYRRLIKPFRFLHWHGGARVFTLFIDSNKFFVKIDDDFERLSNEVYWTQKLSKKYPLNFCALMDSFDLKYSKVAIYEYFKSESFDEIFLDSLALDNKKRLIIQLTEISDILFHHQVVHRDISPGNLLVQINVKGEVAVKLIDLAYAISRNEKSNGYLKNNAIELTLGQEWRPYLYTWDDAYSLFKVLNHVGFSENIDLAQYCKDLELRVGRLTYVSKKTKIKSLI